MMSDKKLESVLAVLQGRLDRVNAYYIRKIASQIRDIGELGQANINRLVIMAEMTSNVTEITRMLEIATRMNTRDIQKIFDAAMMEVHTDRRFSRAFSGGEVPPETRQRMNQYARGIASQTAKTMLNLSNTTAIAKPYQEAVDKAIYAVSAGLVGYKEATRQVVRDIGHNGLMVEYASGHRRRLDTAVRQNIIDGANQIAQQGAKAMGEALGYDAVELTAHRFSAKDHEPVQGRAFLLPEFEKMQNEQAHVDIDGNEYASFKRPIAEWNCKHIALPFNSKGSVRVYSDEQLSEWAEKNNEGCKVDGKHYTIYEASQLMRRIETEVRRWKDVSNAARDAEDDLLRQEGQEHINTLVAKYNQVARLSGLRPRRDRMTVEGFRRLAS